MRLYLQVKLVPSEKSLLDSIKRVIVFRWSTLIINNITTDTRFAILIKFEEIPRLGDDLYIKYKESHDKQEQIGNLFYRFLELKQCYLSLNQPRLKYVIVRIGLASLKYVRNIQL